MRTAVTMLALSVCAFAGNYKLEEREPVQQVFRSSQTLDVSQVNGATLVVGDGGNSIRMEGERIVRADSAEEMARAKREVVLEVVDEGGVARVHVNGLDHEHGDRHYEISWNLTIHVPRAAALKAHAVNGALTAQDTAGAFELRTVNGKLTMTNVAGSGSAETVNGEIKATFRENPKAACSFRTVNGAIDVGFPASFGADLRLKTLNGAIYTDFDATALASAPGEKSRANGMFVYRANRERSVRIGAGGPEMKFETLNGTIKVRKAEAGK